MRDYRHPELTGIMMSISKTIKHAPCPLMLAIAAVCSLTGTGLAREIIDPSTLSAVEWRLVGPFRGGRVTTVTGVPDRPMLYYMGATGGGVWKTENAGATWENISDGFFAVGTIGAVAVSESDNNVLYVGTGESPIRGVTTSHGIVISINPSAFFAPKVPSPSSDGPRLLPLRGGTSELNTVTVRLSGATPGRIKRHVTEAIESVCGRRCRLDGNLGRFNGHRRPGAWVEPARE